MTAMKANRAEKRSRTAASDMRERAIGWRRIPQHPIKNRPLRPRTVQATEYRSTMEAAIEIRRILYRCGYRRTHQGVGHALCSVSAVGNGDGRRSIPNLAKYLAGRRVRRSSRVRKMWRVRSEEHTSELQS